MPEYNDPVARDAIRELRNRVNRQDQIIKRLQANRGVVMSRGDHTAVPNPYEGQTMVGMDDLPYYYSNGAWHPFSTPGGAFRNTSVKYSMGGAEWKTAAMYDTGVSSWKVVDPTVPFGGYIEISNAVDEFFAVGMPLGPRYSTWQIAMAYRTSDDGGRVVFEWQTTKVDGDFGGATVYPEVVEGAEELSSTWYKANSSTTYHQDFYAGGFPGDVFTSSYSPIQIVGEDGAMLSAHGAANSTSNDPGGIGGLREMNGGGDGSVMWWLRARVQGKHASSTGYKARIYYLAVKRSESSYAYDIF